MDQRSAFEYDAGLYDHVVNRGCNFHPVRRSALSIVAVSQIIESTTKENSVTLLMTRLYSSPFLSNCVPTTGCGVMSLSKAVCFLYNKTSTGNPQVETTDQLLKHLIQSSQDITLNWGESGKSLMDALLEGYEHTQLRNLPFFSNTVFKCHLSACISYNRARSFRQKAAIFLKGRSY
jgi:hypothetical protein